MTEKNPMSWLQQNEIIRRLNAIQGLEIYIVQVKFHSKNACILLFNTMLMVFAYVTKFPMGNKFHQSLYATKIGWLTNDQIRQLQTTNGPHNLLNLERLVTRNFRIKIVFAYFTLIWNCNVLSGNLCVSWDAIFSTDILPPGSVG